MNWIHTAVAAVIVSLTVIECSRAGAWRPFQMCKHQTGEVRGRMDYGGVATEGRGWINTQTIGAVYPLPGNKCTLLHFSDGSKVTVIGPFEEVICKVFWGPGCK